MLLIPRFAAYVDAIPEEAGTFFDRHYPSPRNHF
jgi:hypothetical protein